MQRKLLGRMELPCLKFAGIVHRVYYFLGKLLHVELVRLCRSPNSHSASDVCFQGAGPDSLLSPSELEKDTRAATGFNLPMDR